MEQLNLNTGNSTLKSAGSKKQLSQSGQTQVKDRENESFSQKVDKSVSDPSKTDKSSNKHAATNKTRSDVSHDPVEAEDSKSEVGQELPQNGNIIPSAPDEKIFKQVFYDNGPLRLKATVNAADFERLSDSAEKKLQLSTIFSGKAAEKAQQQTGVPADVLSRLNPAVPATKFLPAKNLNKPETLPQPTMALLKEMNPAENISELVKRMSGLQTQANPDSTAQLKFSPSGQTQDSVIPTLMSRTENQELASSAVPKINQPINHPQWGNELANRVVLIGKQNLQQAQIRINPPNLGPIELRVSVQNEQANVTFVSNHAQVREAIESAIPRLKEMFAENGFQSLDVDISSNKQAEKQLQNGKSESDFGSSSYDDEIEVDETVEVRAVGLNQEVGLIDYFA